MASVDLAELEADLRSAALIVARQAVDDGRRTDLDDAIAALGYDRAELEAELGAEVAAGRRSPLTRRRAPDR